MSVVIFVFNIEHAGSMITKTSKDRYNHALDSLTLFFVVIDVSKNHLTLQFMDLVQFVLSCLYIKNIH